MARKLTRKGIVRKLDKLVSQLVIKRDKACVVCGSTNRLCAGHLFSRIAYSTRWDLDNVYASCWNCNYRHEFDPYPMMKQITDRLGQKMVDELHRRYVKPQKFLTYELELMYEYLLRELKEK